MEQSSQSRFWLVVNPAFNSPPTRRHDTYESAIAEAQRLAREFQGDVFHVLVSIEFFEKSDLRHHVFIDNPQEGETAVPF